MGTTVTSHALDKNLTFPYVTIPHFEKRGEGFLKLAGAQYVGICQIIKEDSRSEWESWSVQNQQWIPEAYRPEGVPPNASLIAPFIYDLGGAGGSPQPVESKPDQILYPVWQIAPIVPDYVNFDAAMFVPSLAQSIAMLKMGEPAILSAPQEEMAGDIPADLDNPATWPSTYLVAPIKDAFDMNDMNDTNDTNGMDGMRGMKDMEGTKGTKGTLMAFFVSIIPWHKFFENILPDGTKGMYVIIQSTCGPSLTYQVNGASVEFLGIGDLHDRAFDHLELIGAFVFGDHGSFQHKAACDFTIHTYPTKELYDSMKSNNPIYFTLTVVFIFLLTSIVFVLYDCLVQKRQKKVMTSAQQSNALVSSLFPAQVRDRLMGDDQADLFHTLSGGPNGDANIANLLSTKPIGKFFLALSSWQ
jgi:hypothetical protein